MGRLEARGARLFFFWRLRAASVVVVSFVAVVCWATMPPGSLKLGLVDAKDACDFGEGNPRPEDAALLLMECRWLFRLVLAALDDIKRDHQCRNNFDACSFGLRSLLNRVRSSLEPAVQPAFFDPSRNVTGADIRAMQSRWSEPLKQWGSASMGTFEWEVSDFLSCAPKFMQVSTVVVAVNCLVAEHWRQKAERPQATRGRWSVSWLWARWILTCLCFMGWLSTVVCSNNVSPAYHFIKEREYRVAYLLLTNWIARFWHLCSAAVPFVALPAVAVMDLLEVADSLCRVEAGAQAVDRIGDHDGPASRRCDGTFRCFGSVYLRWRTLAVAAFLLSLGLAEVMLIVLFWTDHGNGFEWAYLGSTIFWLVFAAAFHRALALPDVREGDPFVQEPCWRCVCDCAFVLVTPSWWRQPVCTDAGCPRWFLPLAFFAVWATVQALVWLGTARLRLAWADALSRPLEAIGSAASCSWLLAPALVLVVAAAAARSTAIRRARAIRGQVELKGLDAGL